MEIIVTKSREETFNLGQKLANRLNAGDIVLLYGDLGSGKTVLSSGIVKGLTKQDYKVTSPTFTIVNEYDGEVKVNHFDLYRINHFSELENIGIYEYIFGGGVCVFEWPERAEEFLKQQDNVIIVKISKIDENQRKIIIE